MSCHAKWSSSQMRRHVITGPAAPASQVGVAAGFSVPAWPKPPERSIRAFTAAKDRSSEAQLGPVQEQSLQGSRYTGSGSKPPASRAKKSRSPTAAAAQERLQSLSNELLEKLKVDAGERERVLQQQLTEAQAQVVQATLTAEEQASQLQELRDERAALQQRSDVQASNLTMLESKLGRLAGDVQLLEEAVAAAATARDLLLSERDQLSQQLQQLQTEQATQSSQTVEELAAAQHKAQSLEVALEQSKQLEQHANEQQIKLASQLSDAQRALSDLQQQWSAAEQEMAGVREAMVLSRASQGEMEQDLARLSDELQVKGKLHKAEVRSLKSQLQMSEQERHYLSQRMHEVQSEVVGLSQELEQSSVNRSVLLHQVAALETTLADVTQQLDEACERLAHALQRTHELEVAEAGAAEQADALQQAQQQLHLVQQQLETSDRERHLEVAVIVNNYITAREQSAAALAHITELQSKVDALTSANSALLAEQLENQMALRAAAQAQEQVGMLQGEVASLQSQLSEAQARATELAVDAQQQQEAAVAARKAEAELAQELSLVQHRLSVTEAMVARRAAALNMFRATHHLQPAALPEGAHVNTNRYWAPAALVFDVMKTLASREAQLTAKASGFLGMKVQVEGDQEVVCTSVWDSKQAFERWAWDPAAVGSLSGFPEGVMQYRPGQEGVPEACLPFKSV